MGDTPVGTYMAVDAGDSHSVAIRTDGSLVEWGREIESEFALRPTTGTYIAVAAGNEHSMALRTDGTIVSWGDHTHSAVFDTPDGTFIAVSAGDHHSVAISVSLIPEQILDLSLTVQAFVDDGAPLPSKGQSLQVKLDAAAAAVEVNDTETAIGSLGTFINQTEAFVQTNKLTPAQGQTLIDGAGLIITDLGG